jgi:hypothetical protein
MAVVGTADFNSIVADPHGPFNKATVTNVNDINHDGLVNANDAIYARNNIGNFLPFITAPMSGGAAPGGSGTGQAAVSAPTDSADASPPPLLASPIQSAGASEEPQPPNNIGGLSSADVSGNPSVGLPRAKSANGDGSASTSNSSLPTPLQKSAVSAVWSSIDSNARPTNWWSSGRTADASSDLGDSSLNGSLDQLLSMLAFERHRHRS